MDKEIFDLIKREAIRQQETLMMIPSENYASAEVLSALGSVLQNKYAEGYPGHRYYQGAVNVDQIETIAIDRAKKLFGVVHANVQPYSGSPANAAVYFGLLSPGDKIMGLDLGCGGHLTHGYPKITFSGKYFTGVSYSVEANGFIDYDKVEALAKKEKPQIIVAGTTSYSRLLDFTRFGQIADRVGAYLLADISHIAGLVIAGVHPSPAQSADIITTTTHKTLRGPRGAIIMVTKKGQNKNKKLPQLFDRAVFPGLQGGPHENNIAGIAVALKEASSPQFREYGRQIVKNAALLAQELTQAGFRIISQGTDNHLLVVDLRLEGINGKEAAVLLETAGIVVNANSIPHDPNPPLKPSGIRLGTPALTTRGMKEKEIVLIAQLITAVIKKTRTPEEVKQTVIELTQQFPIPSILVA